jgi:triacylglycerol lipase
MIWFFAVGCGPNNQISQLKSEVTEESRSTRFPIVLHHGFLGFDRIFMIDYFFGVRTALRDAGYDIHATTVAPVNTIAFRAHQLASQIDKVLEETGASKVNIVAHSMGGLDARYLISSLGYGDKVASLTSIATPHQGSLVADVAYRITSADARKLRQGIEYVFLGDRSQHLGSEDIDVDSPVDINGALWNLSVEFLKDRFDAANPDDPRVVYESFAAHSKLIGRSQTPRIQPLLLPFFVFLRTAAGENDGLVTIESARHGTDRGLIEGDHMDVVGQLLGYSMQRFDHRSFYLNLAHSLKTRGF